MSNNLSNTPTHSQPKPPNQTQTVQDEIASLAATISSLQHQIISGLEKQIADQANKHQIELILQGSNDSGQIEDLQRELEAVQTELEAKKAEVLALKERVVELEDALAKEQPQINLDFDQPTID